MNMCVFPWASGHNAERTVEACMHTHLCMSRYQDTPGAGASQRPPSSGPCPSPCYLHGQLLILTPQPLALDKGSKGYPLGVPCPPPTPPLQLSLWCLFHQTPAPGDSDIHPGHRVCVHWYSGEHSCLPGAGPRSPPHPITPTEPNLICLQPGRLGSYRSSPPWDAAPYL